MCGRINLTLDPSDLVAEFDIRADSYDPDERYNVPPGSVIPIIVERPDADGQLVRRLEAARWGLVPGWAKDLKMGFRTFNARAETVESKPMFRAAFAQRRCVVPVAGYYEWKKTESGKQPWYMHAAEGGVLLMAGLFEFRKLQPAEVLDGDPADHDGWLVSASIITRPSAGHLHQLHGRMPVMLTTSEAHEWLDPSFDGEQARSLLDRFLADFDPDSVIRRPVGAAVGNVRNEGPELIVEQSV